MANIFCDGCMDMKPILSRNMRQGKRMIIGVGGFTILAIGIVMIVLPGPAVLIIPAGLGILATEFVWARSLMIKFNQKIKKRGTHYGGNTE